MSNVITFPGANPSIGRRRGTLRKPYERGGAPSMHTFAFRSYEVILESDEADLARDVGLDIHKARVKLRKIQERLQGVQEHAAAQVQMLTEAESKLSAAIAAAVSLTQPPAPLAVKQRRTNSEAFAQKREFKDSMRRRIREVAAILKLSEEQIEWPLTLRHREIGRFCLEHGIQAEWLLEGRGRTFKDDPIKVGPNMTGAEFAEVVRTLPIADQQAIAAKLRQLAERRQ